MAARRLSASSKDLVAPLFEGLEGASDLSLSSKSQSHHPAAAAVWEEEFADSLHQASNPTLDGAGFDGTMFEASNHSQAAPFEPHLGAREHFSRVSLNPSLLPHQPTAPAPMDRFLGANTSGDPQGLLSFDMDEAQGDFNYSLQKEGEEEQEKHNFPLGFSWGEQGETLGVGGLSKRSRPSNTSKKPPARATTRSPPKRNVSKRSAAAQPSPNGSNEPLLPPPTHRAKLA
eukprot:m.4417 g.4417  ORF g.4417 m.4417 type:complete len:230 (-) comp4304_c0_seq1:20-709(-)